MKKLSQIKGITLLNRIVDGKDVPLIIRDNICEDKYKYWIYDPEEQNYRCINDLTTFYSFIPHELKFNLDIIFWEK